MCDSFSKIIKNTFFCCVNISQPCGCIHIYIYRCYVYIYIYIYIYIIYPIYSYNQSKLIDTFCIITRNSKARAECFVT